MDTWLKYFGAAGFFFLILPAMLIAYLLVVEWMK